MEQALLVSQVILWLVIVVMGVVIFALARQIGILHERVAPMGALMTDHSIQVGQPAPVMTLVDIKGHAITLGGSSPRDRHTLLLFVSPTCPICKKLLPAVRSFGRREQRHLDIVLIGDGDRADQERMIREHRLEDMPYVISPEVGMKYQVAKLPYSVLLGSDGTVRAKGLVNSREHLESLMVADETGFASIQDYLRTQNSLESAGRAASIRGARKVAAE
jgi:methylamine dehydrogenase accessory protein MauD